MKPAYINSVAEQYIIENVLNQALHTMLNATDVIIPSLGFNWETSNFLKDIARNISNVMYAEGERIMKAKVKNFNPERTRLTKDVIEEMWHAGSKEFGNEITKGFIQGEGANIQEGKSNRIPGLEQIVREGGIVSRALGFRNSDDPEPEELERHYAEIREKLIRSLESADFRDEFLRLARNNYFEYLQERFEIFTDQGAEMKIH